MEIELTFRFAGPAEAADFLEKANGENWPKATTTQTADVTPAEVAPWDADEADAAASETDANDPWASQAKPAKPAKPKTAQADTSKLFPGAGEYEVETPNGDRTWKFGIATAPECDCGYPSAKVSGKGSNGKTFHRWACPIGFNKEKYRDKCSFSEFAK